MSNDSSITDSDSLALESVTGPFAAIHASHLSAVSGGQWRPVNDGGPANSGGVPPLKLPPNSFSTPASKPKCPPWRAWQGQPNIGITTNGTPAIVPTLHCPLYRPSPPQK
jgi:hypothetical protein